MTVDLEKIVLNGISFNDQVKLSMESMVFMPAQAKAKFAENPNSDGVVLVEEPQYTPAYFEMAIRVINAKNTDEALVVIGEVMDALTECARTEEGSDVEWTPNEASTTYTAYALLGELLELPITMTGELAGWFVEFPVLKIKLTCRPFLFTEERVVLVAVENAESFQVAYVKGIEGDVPAEARMIFRDKATQKRRYLEWGQDIVESESNPALQIKATAMTLTGYVGALAARTGSLSTSAVKAQLVSKPQVICSTGRIANIGSYRLKLRVESTVEGAMVRAAYRVGEGPLTPLPWKEIPFAINWYEIDLREMFLYEVESGEQVTEILIEGKSAATNTIYVDTLDLFPTRRYAVARGPTNLDPPDILAGQDNFEQIAGTTLAGLVAPIGGTWAEFGHAGTFNIDLTNNYITRSSVSDEENKGRVGVLGAAEPTDIVVSCEVLVPGDPAGGLANYGIVARYKSVATPGGIYASFNAYTGSEANSWTIATGSNFGSRIKEGHFTFTEHVYGQWNRLKLVCKANGDYQFWFNDYLVGSGNDPRFATGGELAKGKFGIFDLHVQPGANTRYYRNFSAWVPTIGGVCNSGKALEIRPDTAVKEDPTSKFWSPVDPYRGSDLFLDPAGPDGLINRIAVKARRTDIREEPDNNLTDKQSLEILARERFIAPR